MISWNDFMSHENSTYIINYILKYMQIENSSFKLLMIFHNALDQINSSLMRMRDFVKVYTNVTFIIDQLLNNKSYPCSSLLHWKYINI